MKKPKKQVEVCWCRRGERRALRYIDGFMELYEVCKSPGREWDWEEGSWPPRKVRITVEYL